jgi:uncharacterized protein (TIGR00255 family)
MHSMTGFGRGSAENEWMKIVVEIKTVNHRYTDFNIKMPKRFNQFEELMKKAIKLVVDRGRIEVYVQSENYQASDYVVKPNHAVISQYLKALNEISSEYQINDKIGLQLLTRFQDTLEITTQELDADMVSALLLNAVKDALDSLSQMRRIEGQSLLNDVEQNLAYIESVLSRIEARSPEIVVLYQKKMRDRILELLGDYPVDENRLMMETSIFADKTNIAEEIVRLKAHIIQLRNIMALKEPVGRKLDFLIQEMNREINTIGSKSPDIDISNDVVELKSTLEKIREQVQNIE